MGVAIVDESRFTGKLLCRAQRMELLVSTDIADEDVGVYLTLWA